MVFQRVGFIGLGNMGYPISLNLLRSGYKLVVYDIVGEKIEKLVNEGATGARSPKEVAELSDIVMTSLPTPEALEEVVTGQQGILEADRVELTLIMLDTIPPATARKIALKSSRQGVNVLEAPVSGGPYLAREGALTIMVGGDI
jgi:2-hydroxy-3-oxopropionate reductase